MFLLAELPVLYNNTFLKSTIVNQFFPVALIGPQHSVLDNGIQAYPQNNRDKRDLVPPIQNSTRKKSHDVVLTKKGLPKKSAPLLWYAPHKLDTIVDRKSRFRTQIKISDSLYVIIQIKYSNYCSGIKKDIEKE